MKLTNNQLTVSPINQDFVLLSCKSCQRTPLHLSRELYKSNLFLQNKANFKITRNDINTCTTNTYGNLIALESPKNKAKQSQFKAIFSSKLASFFPISALFFTNISDIMITELAKESLIEIKVTKK